MDEAEKKRKKQKRAAATTAVAAVTSAGIVMGGAFQSPDDLLRGDGEDDAAPIPQTYQPTIPSGDGDDIDEPDEDAGDEEDEERRRSPRARFREWVWGLPVSVRALVGVPLWALGWLILTGLGALWGGVLSPVASGLLSALALAAVLLTAFTFTVKAAFPDLPLKKIVNRRTVPALLIGAAVLAGANAVLPLVWDGYEKFARLLQGLGSAGVLGAISAVFIRRESRRRKKAAEKAALAAEEEIAGEEETLEQAMERAKKHVRDLVDEVGSMH